MQGIEYRTLLAFVVVVSVAFGWVVSPFYGAILWAIVAAIVFEPLNRNLLKVLPRWPNTVALVTLLMIVAIVIVPAILIGTSLVQELLGLYGRIESKELNVAQAFADIQKSLPRSVTRALERFGLTDVDHFSQRFSDGIANVIRAIATGAIRIWWHWLKNSPPRANSSTAGTACWSATWPSRVVAQCFRVMPATRSGLMPTCG